MTPAITAVTAAKKIPSTLLADEVIDSQSHAAGPTTPSEHSPKSFRLPVGITKKEAGGVYRLHGQCQRIDRR